MVVSKQSNTTREKAMLPIQLNPSLGIPIYRQIMDAIRGLIASGTLKPGDKLPSLRELASQLRINPSSAVKAYSELQHAGVISLDQGRGTFVSQKPGLALQSRQNILENDLRALLLKAQSLGFDAREIARAMQSVEKTLKGGRRNKPPKE